MNSFHLVIDGMPSHGAEIIDGIPVILRDSVMYAFQHGTTPTLKIGKYDSTTKKATWDSSEGLSSWLSSYKQSITSRSRK
jgi:hypothetical protein